MGFSTSMRKGYSYLFAILMLATSLAGCLGSEDIENTEVEEELEVEDTEPASDNNEDIVEEPEPVVRNWWCSSSGMGGHHVDPAYEGMTKGELSDEDCQSVNEQFAAAIAWAMQWPTLGEAEDDEFHMVVDYVEGMGTHHTRIGNFSMDDDFDPRDPEFPGTRMDSVFEYDKPEFLMYSGTESNSTLVGFAWYVKTNSTTPPEGFAGDNDWWHRHGSLCFRDETFQAAGEDLSDEECESGPATNVHLHDYWMVHAWIIEPWLQQYDVFANYHPCLSQEGPITDSGDHCWMEAMHGGMHEHEEEEQEEEKETPDDTEDGPCTIYANEGLQSTPNPSDWPIIVDDEWLYADGLTDIIYNESQDPDTAWDDDQSDDMASEEQEEIEDWMCGYYFGVKVPDGYDDTTKDYPVVIFLHGGHTSSAGEGHWLSGQFHIPDEDPYILVIPTKKEWDWEPQKILDLLTDVKSNLRVNEDRVYLTGLSMGGRGTFIVGSALPDQFAALMPLSPHHDPYSYVSLAADVSHLPIWMSFGNIDIVSSYYMATEMVDALEEEGAYIDFVTLEGWGHWGWEYLYSNEWVIDWLLAQERGTPHRYSPGITMQLELTLLDDETGTPVADKEVWIYHTYMDGQYYWPAEDLPVYDTEVDAAIDEVGSDGCSCWKLVTNESGVIILDTIVPGFEGGEGVSHIHLAWIEDFGDGVLLFDSVSEDFIEIYQSLYGDHVFYIETEMVDGVVHGQTVVNL